MQGKVIGFIAILFFICTTAAAHKQVVVIPLSGGGGGNLQNVITVSPSGGDFTNPIAAMNSIVDADSSNRYLVMIGPGVYTLNQALVIKPYVDVRGAGMDVTKLTGAISSNTIGGQSAIIVGGNYSTLSDLSILNFGSGNYSIGIYNSTSYTMRIERVDIQAWGGGTGAYGTCGNYGIYNSTSHPRIYDSIIYAAGKYAYGIYNAQSSPTLERVWVDAWVDEDLNCCGAFGMSSFNSSHPTVRYSDLRGSSYGFQQSGGEIKVYYSTIRNMIDTGGSAIPKCIHSDNGDGLLLRADCYNTYTPY